MAIEIFEGYESNKLPPIEQRVVDAEYLRERGAVAIMGAAVNPTDDPLKTILAEMKISFAIIGDDKYIIGPYVNRDDSGNPFNVLFIPHGLCLWKMPQHET